jgi:repressor LexA
MPTYSEMMKLFDFKSKNAVFRLINRLAETGLVEKDKTGRLLQGSTFNELMVLGSVKAGFPSPAEEELQDTMSLDDFLIEKKESTYIVVVDGDSMIDAHIEDGDIVIAERATIARDGQIVIANIDGEFTMKYFRQKGGKAWLEPANKNFRPMHPEYNLDIVAIIRGVVRKY